MTDTAPPEQVLTEAADKAMELSEHFAVPGGTGQWTEAGVHLAYLAGLIRGGITNLAIAYDRGWDEGYDAAPTPLAAPPDMAAVWQDLNDEQRAVVCVVSPELAGMLDAAEDPAPKVKTETQAEPPPHYLARLQRALGNDPGPALAFDEVVERVRSLHLQADRTVLALNECHDLLARIRGELLSALGIEDPDQGKTLDDALTQSVGAITRARRAAHAWAGTGEPGEVAATALQDLVHYLDERAA